MDIGIILPQGWNGEYVGWEPRKAWLRTVHIAEQAETLGFESIWLFDHFHTVPRPTDEITFESFTSLAAVSMVTKRVRIGHVVVCTGFRNPALTAKMISTMDVISGGRMELGIGAGWKRDEWLAYGYGFPETRERLAMLGDHLEVIDRMLRPGVATYEGVHASVNRAINNPKGLQSPRVPIMVGGNGQNVTWRYAARFADELNLDGVTPEQVREWLPIIASRCEEIDRDPATLRISVHIWWGNLPPAGSARQELLAGLREAGVHRVQTLVKTCVEGDEALESMAEDARASGASMA
jgi:alkanesulfonate monooxygenase SsuD/methylene tetrahydromethanopterin reductase-like flavin-dependent oxidoreductase (luciferase family)